jgi:hypothetical protein
MFKQKPNRTLFFSLMQSSVTIRSATNDLTEIQITHCVSSVLELVEVTSQPKQSRQTRILFWLLIFLFIIIIVVGLLVFSP